MRLKVEIGGGDPKRDLYHGSMTDKTSNVNVNGFHILNEVVVDRGPSPYCV